MVLCCHDETTDRLVQAEMADVKFIEAMPESAEEISSQYSLVVDCIFGFSFQPPVRPQFSPILELLSQLSSVPLVSVDIPSGWGVEAGPPEDGATPRLRPAMLVSLTAPKLCAAHHTGHHYLGGRFVPRQLADKYQLDLPTYPGTDLVVKLS